METKVESKVGGLSETSWSLPLYLGSISWLGNGVIARLENLWTSHVRKQTPHSETLISLRIDSPLKKFVGVRALLRTNLFSQSAHAAGPRRYKGIPQALHAKLQAYGAWHRAVLQGRHSDAHFVVGKWGTEPKGMRCKRCEQAVPVKGGSW